MGNCSPKEEKGAFVFGFAMQRWTGNDVKKRKRQNRPTVPHCGLSCIFLSLLSILGRERAGAPFSHHTNGGNGNDGKSSLAGGKTLRILPGGRP